MKKNKNNILIKWRNIPGYEGKYVASTNGDIISLKSQSILGARLHTQGYKRVTLYDKEGKAKEQLAHVVILETFKGKRPKNKVCNHIDENKTNNRLDNLEWVNKSKNFLHSYYPGSNAYKANQKNAKRAYTSTSKKVQEINSGKVFKSQSAAQRYFKLPNIFISAQLKGTAYKTSRYQFRRV